MSCENCPFNVCGEVLNDGTMKKLANLNGVGVPALCQEIAKFICDSDPSNAEVFRQFSTKRGRPKSHFSGVKEESMVRKTDGPRNSRTNPAIMPHRKKWIV